ncbi:Na+/H+ antiporter NhaA [Hoeflea sp. YIM 152468]|uniref:Na+/H+ antiporter NhaA n=1 Tax=Hoeflea sp. YIM 152468 TaxID=3031759 RepID=UPI0023DBAFC5|nr:Na+/H+ antiporter NhaA [Hoeflea sp. YIM 152468]MDF1609929.1 Na+/H+ antiporter NhaA [Hoeflea sp. YIM 152468]
MIHGNEAGFHIDRDFYLGEPDCQRAVFLYGDYTSDACRRLRDILRRIADRQEGRIVYIYRQYPQPENSDADRAARAAIAAGEQGKFWEMHQVLFRRGESFSADNIGALAEEIGLDIATFDAALSSGSVEAHLTEDRELARLAGVTRTPTLFIAGEPYLGAWDELSIMDAVEQPLGFRVERASQRFFGWAASGGLLLVLATLAALAVANTGLHEVYETLRTTMFAFEFGEARFALSLEAWINDGLMTIFFLIVGIEIKREMVSGELSDLSSALLPIFGALGGMVMPALIYIAFNLGGPAAHGWGIPMATDIAFTLGLMALLGRRVPNSLKIFVAALAIADDLGAIVVIALFYGHGLHFMPMLGALGCIVAMALLGRARIYALAPYLGLGLVLWVFVHASGLHATLAGVLTAMLIPARRPAKVQEVAAQATVLADTIGPDSDPVHDTIADHAVKAMEHAITRLREPGYHLQHALENWTNFLILPLFAFFNTGVLLTGSTFSPFAPETLGVMLGLIIGKPLGIVAACWIAVRAGWANLSSEISWSQFVGAGCLAGVGFTMSIFIANAAFEGTQLGAVKLAVLLGSLMSAIIGATLLLLAGTSTSSAISPPRG